MDKDLDNANPTILSAAQLPTRQNKRLAPKTGPETLYHDIVHAKPWYLSRPFCDDDSLWSDRDAVDDTWVEEPIDEQEIYGEASPLFSQFPFRPSYHHFLEQILGSCMSRLPASLSSVFGHGLPKQGKHHSLQIIHSRDWLTRHDDAA